MIQNKYKGVVNYLIFINIAIYILQVFNPEFMSQFVLNSQLVWTQPWLLITSMFMHGSPGHIFFNLYSLYLFGTLMEQKMGSNRFLFLYALSGIVGGIFFALMNPTSSAVGASGAIMGLLGITIILLPHLRVLFFFIVPMSMRTAGIIFALINLGVFGQLNGVAYSAHFGGLVVGLIYGVYLLKQKNSFAKRFVAYAAKPQRENNYDNTIEMSENDIDDYIKHGRL